MLSAALTGFDEGELHATGMVEVYHATVLARLGEPELALLTALLEEGRDIEEALPPRDPRTAEAAVAIAYLWYTGAWPTAEGGAVVVSPETYAAGLLWTTFGGHAPGTVGPGYGSWSTPPLSGAGAGLSAVASTAAQR
ncbi:hypothetical protein [Kitasatospora nipponensis]|uniref:hypothetical protein n=1 Tax=Kitasatospora nipponensis TaxID=258049 RepID=UPI0031D581FF